MEASGSRHPPSTPAGAAVAGRASVGPGGPADESVDPAAG